VQFLKNKTHIVQSIKQKLMQNFLSNALVLQKK